MDVEIPETKIIRRLLELIRQRLRHVPDSVHTRRMSMTMQVFTCTLTFWDNEKQTDSVRAPLRQLPSKTGERRA